MNNEITVIPTLIYPLSSRHGIAIARHKLTEKPAINLTI